MWTYLVFGFATVAALGLISGRWPRVSALVLLLFVAGLVSVARPLTSGATGVLCFLYFWIALMPLVGSADSLRGFAVLGLRLQVVLVYLCGVTFKLFDPSWQAGYPLAGALVGHTWESELGRWFAMTMPPSLLLTAGKVVTGVELVGPLVLVLPVTILRRSAIVLLTGFHLGTALLMKLEVFPWAMVAILAVYWDREMVAWVRRLCGWVWSWRGKFREGVAVVMIVLSIVVALGQVVLPRIGLRTKGQWIVNSVKPLNDTSRYNQHWTMFTTNSVTPSPDRGNSVKTYRTTRLLVKTASGDLFDPFTGKMSSVGTTLRLGHEHPAVSRKALSYLQKQSGHWRERQIRAFARWAAGKAVEGGHVPSVVFVYRYQIPVDLSQPLGPQYEETRAIARLWVRVDLQDEGEAFGKIEIFGAREASPISVRLKVD